MNHYTVEPCDPWDFEIEPGRVVTGTWAFTVYADGEAVASGPARTLDEAEKFAIDAMANL